jgi:hypothetical protein
MSQPQSEFLYAIWRLGQGNQTPIAAAIAMNTADANAVNATDATSPCVMIKRNSIVPMKPDRDAMSQNRIDQPK